MAARAGLPGWALKGVATGLLAVAAVTLALVTRLPFLDRTLFISDSARYAFALEHYDMSLGRPHPPGNPLYVALAAAVDRLGGDPVFSLGLLSALLSGAAFFFAYLLARDLAGETAGLLAAAVLATSPLFWFFGCVAMPATGEAALSLLFAWLARRARAPGEGAAFWAMTATLALAFGYRSTFAIFVFPLWLYGAWRHRRPRQVAGLITLAAAACGWTALVASRSGGWEAYQRTSSAFLHEVVIATKILGGGLDKVPTQAAGVLASLLFALGPFLIPFAVGLGRTLTGRPPFPGAGLFLAAWALPMLAFHLIYDWAPRFAVPLLAPAAVLAAATAVPLARRLLGERAGALPAAAAVLALAVNAGLFLLPVELGPLRLPDPYPGGPRLLARNADFARRDAAVRARFDPATSLLLAYDHTFHAAWFLPEYRVVGLFPLFKATAEAGWVPSARGRRFSFEPGSTALVPGNPLLLPAEVRQLVLYDPDYVDHWPRPELPLEAVPYDLGRALQVATVASPGCLAYGSGQLQWRSGAACAKGGPVEGQR